MTGDIRLPSMIDPEARHLEFRVTQCEECGQASPPVLADNPEWYEWMSRHADATGHTRIYQWALTRSRGQHTTLRPDRVRPARRALGGRDR